MSDPKNPRVERVDSTHEDSEEKLEDLEPGEGEEAAVKGGGGSTKNQTGSEPEN